MAPYHLGNVAQLLGVKEVASLPLSRFCVDSRQVGEGDLFFALPGQRVDGHHYLAEVSARGATAAVVDRAYTGPDHGLALLPVDDALASLQALARDRLQKQRVKVAAVTGSIGKTTTKEFLATLLRQKYRVGASRSNHNSQIGLPLTLLNDMTDTDEVWVLEMGMTHPGNLKQLLTIAPADIAVLTAVALAHAENFESIEHLACTKAEIFTHPQTFLGIVHRDISNYDEVSGYGVCPKLSFSLKNPSADYYLEPGEELTVVFEGHRHCLGRLHVPGSHHRHNFLAAVAAAHSLGVEWDQITAAIPLLSLPERRMQLVPKDGVLFVNDSYNACDVSVKAALDNLPSPGRGARRIAVLGTMPFLGKFSDACHRDVGLYALDQVDYLFCLGVECQPMINVWNESQRSAQLFTDRRELIRALDKFLQAGDVVLLKGANSKKMWEVLDEITLSR